MKCAFAIYSHSDPYPFFIVFRHFPLYPPSFLFFSSPRCHGKHSDPYPFSLYFATFPSIPLPFSSFLHPAATVNTLTLTPFLCISPLSLLSPFLSLLPLHPAAAINKMLILYRAQILKQIE